MILAGEVEETLNRHNSHFNFNLHDGIYDYANYIEFFWLRHVLLVGDAGHVVLS